MTRRCDFCGEALSRKAHPYRQRARRVEHTVAQEADARACSERVRHELAHHRPIPEPLAILFMTAIAFGGALVGTASHPVIGVVFAGVCMAVYVLAHEAMWARARHRVIDAKAWHVTIEVNRCEVCGAPFQVTAGWPRCAFCTSTAAPNATLDRQLRRRTTAALRQANAELDGLRDVHRTEEERATLLATVLIVAMLAVLGVLEVLF